MTYLHTILPAFVLPIGFTLVLVAAGLYFRRRALFAIAGAVLWISSTNVLSGLLLRRLERSVARVAPADAPVADAIVVLGGGRIVTPGPAAIYEWREPDRFFGGVALMNAGKAPLLVFTVPGTRRELDTLTEGSILVGYAKAVGVPGNRILTTRRVANTADEARAVAELLREHRVAPREGGRIRVLLVTSAFHVARARVLFERAGLAVTPFPVEFQAWPNKVLGLTDFVPSADALKNAELAWHELFGRLYYRVF